MDHIIDLLYEGYRQVAEIKYSYYDSLEQKNKTEYITEKDILQGGLVIDRSVENGPTIGFGSAVSNQLTLKLENGDGRFDNKPALNTRVRVRVGVKKWDALEWEDEPLYWIPCGYFNITERVTNGEKHSITIKALDDMYLLDKPVDFSTFPYDTTDGVSVENIIDWALSASGVGGACIVQSVFGAAGRPNAGLSTIAYDYWFYKGSQIELENSNYTYRDLIRRAAFMLGANAFYDHLGQLNISWYGDLNVWNTSRTERAREILYSRDCYQGLSWDYENRYKLKGVKFEFWGDRVTTKEVPNPTEWQKYFTEFADKNIHFIGTKFGDDALGNNLIAYSKLNTVIITPFTAKIKSSPHIWPMDIVQIWTGNEEGIFPNILSAVTKVTYTLNQGTVISADRPPRNADTGTVDNNYYSQLQNTIFTNDEKFVINVGTEQWSFREDGLYFNDTKVVDAP